MKFSHSSPQKTLADMTDLIFTSHVAPPVTE